MVDKNRSYIMSCIRGKNTKPELKIERILRKIGMKFKKHPDLMGHPDFLLNDGSVLFVDGCFWHGCSKHFKLPKTNVKFWRDKISRNKRRRKEIIRAFREKNVIVRQIWEHDLK